MTDSIQSTPDTLITHVEARQAALGLSDQALCEAVGFERPITLALIKAGTLKMPINKIPALAQVLSLDAASLMRTALTEMSPELLKTVEQVFNHLSLTAAEVNLVKHLRKLSGNQAGAPIVFDGKGVIALVAV